jgi:S1-C subfamily serine protease
MHNPLLALLSRAVTEIALPSISWTSKCFAAGVLTLSVTSVALSAGQRSITPDFGGSGGSDQARIVAAVAHAKPSVVAIEVALGSSDDGMLMDGQDSEGRASGSGFVYGSDGDIVTNAHVVAGPSGSVVQSIAVDFANGDRVPAHVVSMDPAADIAVLKVDGYAKLPLPLALGDSSAVKAGQWAIAIGEPLELKQSVTVGVVSAFNRTEDIGEESDEGDGARQFTGLLQTSAPINPGNSGGPLLDMSGRVIGINQSVAGGAQGIGFAIPIDVVRTTVADLLQRPTNAPDVAALPPQASGSSGLMPPAPQNDDGGSDVAPPGDNGPDDGDNGDYDSGGQSLGE